MSTGVVQPVPPVPPGAGRYVLPAIDDSTIPGARIVRRAVSLTLAVAALLLLAASAVVTFVHIDQTVDGTGALEPLAIWPVRSLEAGVIQRVLVKTGDTVAAGQPLARLDSLDVASTLAQLEGQIEAAKLEAQHGSSSLPIEREQRDEAIAAADARILRARASLRERMVEFGLGSNVDSVLRTYKDGSYTAIDLELGELRAAQADRQTAAAQLAMTDLEQITQHKERVNLAELENQARVERERLQRLTIAAPTRGIVLTEHLERLAGAALRSGDMLMEIAEPNAWRTEFYVQQRDVFKIHLGDSVKIRVQALDALDVPLLGGHVTYVAQQPSDLEQRSDAQSLLGLGPAPAAGPGLYRVVALLDRRPLSAVGVDKFRRGYTAQAKVITKSGRIASLLWSDVREHFHWRWLLSWPG